MPKLIGVTKRLIAVTALAASLGLSGCGGVDGVELQGGVFDALGLSGSNKPDTKNVKVAARPGLILPPSEQALPPPTDGAPAPGPLAGEAWPVDPEQRKKVAEAQLDKQHKDFCERALTNARLRGENGVIMGPKGNCQPGAFGNLTKALEGK